MYVYVYIYMYMYMYMYIYIHMYVYGGVIEQAVFIWAGQKTDVTYLSYGA